MAYDTPPIHLLEQRPKGTGLRKYETACGRIGYFHGATRGPFLDSPFACGSCVRTMRYRDRKFRKASLGWFK